MTSGQIRHNTIYTWAWLHENSLM